MNNSLFIHESVLMYSVKNHDYEIFFLIRHITQFICGDHVGLILNS